MSEAANPGERGASAPCSVEASKQGADAPRSPRSRKRLALAALVVVILAGVGVWFAVKATGPKDDLARFQGEWSLSVGRRDNVGTVRVEGDRWTYVSPSGETATRLVLNPTADPKEIDLIRLGDDGQPLIYTRGEKTAVRQTGVYAIDGDAIRVNLSPYPDPRPRSLDPAEATVWVLSRPKK